MNEDGALFDSRFDGSGPFRDTPEAGGISLESALRDFGPAAIDDLIPRVEALAAALDAAHLGGAVHGALHPSKVIITDDTTSLIVGLRSTVPYIAPEVAAGDAPTPASDQFALAAITYEWLFGRPIDRPAERPVEVRSMPGVERAALSRAFTRALSPRPEDRFATCAAFCEALASSVVPELPLALALEPEPQPDVEIAAEEMSLAAAEPDFDAIDQVVPQAEQPVASWNPSAAATPVGAGESQKFGGMALILATIVGAVFGFAAGYMARPRALQSSAPQEIVVAPGTESPIQAAPSVPATEPVAPAPKAAEPPKRAPQVAKATKKAPPKVPAVSTGSIAVDSRPIGAAVSIDGRPRGKTPLTVNDLAPGDYRVTMAMPGFRNFATTVRVVAGERVRAAASLTAQEQE